MKYNIRGENIEVTSAIRDYIEKKISKVERYFTESPDANVNVHLRINPDKSSKVEVTIPLTHLVLRGEETNADMYAGIDLVTDKLERQIRKHKTRINRKLRKKGKIPITFNVPEQIDGQEADEEELEVVRTKLIGLKPMDSEEAILQMNMLGHNFYVYTNSDTSHTNVVYQRKDGRYGLIESL